MNGCELLIWSSMTVLGYFTLHSVIERVFCHASHRLAAQFELREFCAKVRMFRSIDFALNALGSLGRWSRMPFVALVRRDPLAWITPFLHDVSACGSDQMARIELKKRLYNFESLLTRFSSFLSTMVNVGGYLGLMGTVLAFVQMTDTASDFSELIAFAFQTTLVGLLISTPASLTYGLLAPRADAMLAQVGLVLDALEDAEQLATSDETAPAEVDFAPLLAKLSKYLSQQEMLLVQQASILNKVENCLALSDHLPVQDARQRVFALAAVESDPLLRANGRKRTTRREGQADGRSTTD